MKGLADNPVFLLLVVGGLLGLSFPFGKAAVAAGVDPVAWALVISGAPGVVLAAVLLANGYRNRPDTWFVRYCFVSGLLSYVLPNILIFLAIPKLGAGFVGLMFTLSPVITLAFSMIGGIRVPSRMGIAGIAIGFAGALMLTATRGEIGATGGPGWIALALMIPVILAGGNIYRAVDWPAGREPLELSAFSNLAAGIVLVAFLAATRGGVPLAQFANAPWLALGQLAMASMMYALFFRVQMVGGPVYLSQIGYVAAAVGLAAGMVFLGERYPPLTWLGAAILAVGIGFTIRAQVNQTK